MREAISRQPLAVSQTTKPRPFLKWAGGKGQMLEQYRPLLPKTFGRYLEPFVGAGAVFFDLGRVAGWISDANEELMNAYRVVRDDPELLLAFLRAHEKEHCEAYYYAVRSTIELTDVARAGRFIYLNRTCFNGLYRVNRKGLFNVPMGDYKNPKIVDGDNILACSAVLSGGQVACGGFETVLDVACPRDFVYFDPPYDVTSTTASFTAFCQHPFRWPEQEKLAEVFGKLAVRGVKVMASNADTERVRELYKDFDVRTVGARRAINSSGDKRGVISEVVVLSYDPEAA